MPGRNLRQTRISHFLVDSRRHYQVIDDVVRIVDDAMMPSGSLQLSLALMTTK
jgi:hypothetical protein